jgi:putative peptidoglycan lipid II flippase
MAPDASTPPPEGSTTGPGGAGEAPVTGEPSPSEAAGLGVAAGKVSAATLASRALGVVREQVVAIFFGAGNAADAFNIAFRIPNLLRDLFAEGALSAAFVPTFTGTLAKEGKQSAFQLGSRVVSALALVILVVIVAAWFATPLLVKIMAPGFAEVAGKQELTVLLARVMLPFLLMVALAAAATGMLNSLHRFSIAALAPIWFNIGTIAVTISLVPVFRSAGIEPIVALAGGVLVGGLLQLTLQLPTLMRLGYRFRFHLDLKHPGVRKVALLMGPAAIGLSATQINVVINSLLASTLGTGAVSWLAYAFRVVFVPIGLFGVALATVSLPTLSREVSVGDIERFKGILIRALRLGAALSLPAAVGLAALARPLTALLYEHGRFTPFDTIQTANALIAFSVGLAAYSGVKVIVPAFYALGDTKTPLKASFIAVVVNLGLNLIFMQFWGHVGLALSTGLTAVFNFTQLWLWLERKIGKLPLGELRRTIVRAAAASILMGLLVGGGVLASARWWSGNVLAQAVVLIVGVGGGAALVLWLYRLLGVEERVEMMAAARSVLGKFRRR